LADYVDLDPDALVVCPKCGTKNTRTERFCTNCDEDLEQARSRAPKAPKTSSDEAPSVALVTCPVCSGPMERGYVWAESTIGGYGPKWFTNKSLTAIGGELLARQDFWGNAWIQGYRCAKCRTLVLRY
jgi:hypothetical protein